ncbi:BON domain-containing protein [Marichromatium bheemlicum]|uniref:BON domain-containing protein n=1 Tax=Marichromatium bheemlicum TaxID=365339 RepID=A0ABX1I9B3_9GAMM|nr:BON domain-containing protein [Marichromatium bheemlicum]NKN33629.1 BON domain-containing protein [Marichromatium bheemlicum]
MPFRSTPERARTRRAATLALVLASSLLGGCGALVVGGITVGAAALYDRRPYYVVIDDQHIEMNAISAIQQDRELQDHARISVTSYNYRVLLTGQAERPELAQRAVDKVRRLAKVQQVVDEITIGPRVSLARKSEDAYLTSRVKLALTKVDLEDFDATRVKVVSEDGVVYLMGLVNPAEADAAAEKARYVRGVKRVVKLFEYRPSSR